MNLSQAESVLLARALRRAYVAEKLGTRLELVLCPSFPALAGVATALKGSGIKLGAQDVFWKNAGPYTGEVSPEVLKELGVTYVLVGHSERRQYLGETDAMVQQKVLATLAAGLTPVLCVGETYSERTSGRREIVIAQEVRTGLSGASLAAGQRVVIAYEPVWVIGSGQAVPPSEAQQASHVVRETLFELLPASELSNTAVLYGGSVDPSNITSYVQESKLQGVLVGGASLEAKRFISLLKRFI